MPRSVDVRRLPEPSTTAAVITAIKSHEPDSLTFRLMTPVAYNAGLRPVGQRQADAACMAGFVRAGSVLRVLRPRIVWFCGTC